MLTIGSWPVSNVGNYLRLTRNAPEISLRNSIQYFTSSLNRYILLIQLLWSDDLMVGLRGLCSGFFLGLLHLIAVCFWFLLNESQSLNASWDFQSSKSTWLPSSHNKKSSASLEAVKKIHSKVWVRDSSCAQKIGSSSSPAQNRKGDKVLWRIM